MNAIAHSDLTTANTVEANADAAHPVDLHVGGRVRLRRKFLGLSQEALAAAIGLTFQQVQKYERGSNRISCSKLFDIAAALKVPPAYFFEGYAADVAAVSTTGADILTAETAVSAFLMTSEGIELAQMFPRIKNHKLRRQILAFAQTLAESGA